MSLVTDHLTERGMAFEPIAHTRTFTSIQEARALGVAADEVVKTVAMTTTHGRALAVIPASRRLNMRLVRRVTGDQHARLATEDELQSNFAECELGALPPLGSLLNASTYVDPEVLQHDMVVFAAGSQTESVKARTRELFREGEMTVAPLTTQPERADEEPITT